MTSIREMALKSQQYIDSLPENINRVVFSVEKDIVDLNRSQLLNHRGNDDKPLIHIRTGKETLSKGYARKMRKTYPDLFVDGSYQGELVLHPAYKLNTYSITSNHRLEKYLPNQYKNTQGIAPSNQPKAQEITGDALAKDYINFIT